MRGKKKNYSRIRELVGESNGACDLRWFWAFGGTSFCLVDGVPPLIRRSGYAGG